MRKIKLIAFLTSILSALSLLSTGFSSWYYVNYPETKQAFGAMTAYEVEDIAVNIESFDVFHLSALSFRDKEDNSTSDNGSIEITCSIPSEVIEKNLSSFSVRFELTAMNLSEHATNETKTNPNFGLFQSFVQSSTNEVTAKMSINDTESNVPLEKTNQKLTATCNFTNVSSANDLEFTLTFTFNVPGGANFRDSFGKYISLKSDNYTKFVVSAYVSDT